MRYFSHLLVGIHDMTQERVGKPFALSAHDAHPPVLGSKVAGTIESARNLGGGRGGRFVCYSLDADWSKYF